MAELGIILCVHGEVVGTDPYKREAAFLTRELPRLATIPHLRMVLEHMSTAAAVRALYAHAKRYADDAQGVAKVAATVTPQHLLLSREALLAGGLRPHNYCLPLLQGEYDRRALLWALGTSASG